MYSINENFLLFYFKIGPMKVFYIRLKGVISGPLQDGVIKFHSKLARQSVIGVQSYNSNPNRVFLLFQSGLLKIGPVKVFYIRLKGATWGPLQDGVIKFNSKLARQTVFDLANFSMYRYSIIKPWLIW